MSNNNTHAPAVPCTASSFPDLNFFGASIVSIAPPSRPKLHSLDSTILQSEPQHDRTCDTILLQRHHIAHAPGAK